MSVAFPAQCFVFTASIPKIKQTTEKAHGFIRLFLCSCSLTFSTAEPKWRDEFHNQTFKVAIQEILNSMNKHQTISIYILIDSIILIRYERRLYWIFLSPMLIFLLSGENNRQRKITKEIWYIDLFGKTKQDG